MKKIVSTILAFLVIGIIGACACAEEFSMMDLISKPLDQTGEGGTQITINDRLSFSLPAGWERKSLDSTDQYFLKKDGKRASLSVNTFSIKSDSSLESWFQYYKEHEIRSEWYEINGLKVLISEEDTPHKLELMYRDEKGYLLGIWLHADNGLLESEKLLSDMNQILYSVEPVDNRKASSEELLGESSICADLSNTVAGGSAGNAIRWTLTENGILYFAGSGAMDDFEWDVKNQKAVQPWDMYRNLIREVEFEDGIINIGECALRECRQIERIRIPASVTNIGWCAFEGCSGIKEFVVAQNNPSYTAVEGVLFDKAMHTLIMYPAKKEGVEYTVPETVRRIKDFSYCNLNTITFPDSVTSIDGGAFAGCENLTDVVLPKNLKGMEMSLFWGDDSLRSITVPKSVKWISYSSVFICNQLRNVYYEGTEEDWNRIIIDPMNMDLLNANIHFSAEKAISAYTRIDTETQSFNDSSIAASTPDPYTQGLEQGNDAGNGSMRIMLGTLDLNEMMSQDIKPSIYIGDSIRLHVEILSQSISDKEVEWIMSDGASKSLFYIVNGDNSITITCVSAGVESVDITARCEGYSAMITLYPRAYS